MLLYIKRARTKHKFYELYKMQQSNCKKIYYPNTTGAMYSKVIIVFYIIHILYNKY